MLNWRSALPRTPPLVAALGLLTTISGCATTEGRLTAAATLKGQSEAKVVVPDLPAECRQHLQRVTPQPGDKARWIQGRWEANADAVDRQIDDCAAFHDDYKRRMTAK